MTTVIVATKRLKCPYDVRDGGGGISSTAYNGVIAGSNPARPTLEILDDE